MNIRNQKRKSDLPFVFDFFCFFRSYSSFLCYEKGISKFLKDFFVPDSNFINQWMEAYSGSELWGVLLDFFYQLKAPISILFLLCVNYPKDNLQNLCY
jgi:hypothetical protein